MFEKLIHWIFHTEPKTNLEEAVEKILDMETVSNHGLTETDPVNGSYFAVGKIKYRGASVTKDYFTVNFGNKQEDVVIKYGGEIFWYFNTPEEVQEVRDAIIKCHENMLEKAKKKLAKEFKQL